MPPLAVKISQERSQVPFAQCGDLLPVGVPLQLSVEAAALGLQFDTPLLNAIKLKRGWGPVRAGKLAVWAASRWTTAGQFLEMSDTDVNQARDFPQGVKRQAVLQLRDHLRALLTPGMPLCTDDADAAAHLADVADSNTLRSSQQQARRHVPRTECAAQILDDIHATSGAIFTRNSRRLQPRYGLQGDALQAAMRDTDKDIIDMAHIGVEDATAILSGAFEALKDIGQMRTCGACGQRAPSGVCMRPHRMHELPRDHWLRVPDGAVDVLDTYLPGAPSCQFRTAAGMLHDGVRRRDFHHIYQLGNDYFHVAQEAVSEGNEDGEGSYINCCDRCDTAMGRTSSKDYTLKRADGIIAADFLHHNPTFYRDGAPPDTYAAGYDWGRRWVGDAERGRIDLGDASMLETLVLATHRMHHVSVKLRVHGEKHAGRQRLQSNTIVFPQTFVDAAPDSAVSALPLETALLAALGRVNILFVGPTGVKGALERAALKVSSLRLDATVVYNGLLTMQFLHGGPEVPAWEAVALVNSTAAVQQHVQQMGEELTSKLARAVDNLANANDITNTRLNAMSDADVALAACQDGISTREDGAGCADLLPDESHYGVFRPAEQEMCHFLSGVDRLISEADGEADNWADNEAGADGGDADSPPGLLAWHQDGDDVADLEVAFRSLSLDCDEGNGGNPGAGGCCGDGMSLGVIGDACEKNARRPDVHARRDSEPTDDYGGAARALYGGWTPLFPLKAGLKDGEAITNQQMRRMALHYDCRYAHNLELIFHLANVRMRHDVNKAVRLRSGAEHA